MKPRETCVEREQLRMCTKFVRVQGYHLLGNAWRILAWLKTVKLKA
jgi:hypothetical protein